MPAAFFRRIHWATAKPKRKEEIAQHKRHYRTLHCCGAVQLAVCGRVLLRGPSQRVCVVRKHDERHEHLCAADHRRDDEVSAVPEESVRLSAHASVRVCPLAQMVRVGRGWGRGGGVSWEGSTAPSIHENTNKGAAPTPTRALAPCSALPFDLAAACSEPRLPHRAGEACAGLFAALDVLRIRGRNQSGPFTATKHRWSDPVRIRAEPTFTAALTTDRVRCEARAHPGGPVAVVRRCVRWQCWGECALRASERAA